MQRLQLLSVCLIVGCGPTPSAFEAVVGPAGGVVAADDVSLIVFAGSLSRDVTIRITRTDRPIPAGRISFSPIYHFEPDGLTFDPPAEVRISFEGDPDRAALFWSEDGIAYEQIPGRVVGNQLHASVPHLSYGFVGTVVDSGVPVDAGVPGDAGESDSAVPTDDCSDVPPTVTSFDGAVSITEDPTVGDACVPGPVSSLDAAAFTIAVPQQLTLWIPYHIASSPAETIGVRRVCTAAAPACLATVGYGPSAVLTTLLDPGSYVVSASQDTTLGIHATLEALPSSPPNISCATAIPYQQSPGTFPRAFASETLFFTFQAFTPGGGTPGFIPGTDRFGLTAYSATTRAGTVSISVRTACDDSASVIASGSVGYGGGSYYPPPSTVDLTAAMNSDPYATYYVLVNVTPGMSYDLGYCINC